MRAFAFVLFLLAAAPAAAQDAGFHPGPALPAFGPVATIDSDLPLPPGATYKIRFDVSEAAKPGETNRSFVSAARFLNMSVEGGVPAENVRLAIVVHGGATRDLTRRDDNASAPLIAALIAAGAEFYQCGQSAVAHEVKKEDLLPDINMALSAMHAHAALDAEGYSLNPF